TAYEIFTRLEFRRVLFRFGSWQTSPFRQTSLLLNLLLPTPPTSASCWSRPTRPARRGSWRSGSPEVARARYRAAWQGRPGLGHQIGRAARGRAAATHGQHA